MGIQINGTNDVISAADGSLTVLGTELKDLSQLNVTGVATAASLVVSGNASIGGTITYMDVSNVDSVGIITAQQGIQVLANGLDVTGVSTFNSGAIDQAVQFQSSDSNVRIKLKDGDATNGVFIAGKGESLAFETNGNNERARIDTSGRVLINTSTSRIVEDRAGNGPQGRIQIEGQHSDCIQSIISASTIDAHRCGTLSLGRHRNDTVGGTPTIVQDGDSLGAICFAGGDGVDMRVKGATIHAVVNGTPATDDIPADLVFGTNSGSQYPVERLRITSTGDVVLAAGSTIGSSVGVVTYYGDGSQLSGISVGITTTERTGLGNTTIFLDLSSAQHHTITLAAGISTIDCTGGAVGESHSVVLINPSSVGTGVTVGFATDFLFPSGSSPALPTGANDISLISFVVKQTGIGGTQVLASAGLDYQ